MVGWRRSGPACHDTGRHGYVCDPEVGRLHAVYTYAEIVQKAYEPVNKVWGTLYDVIQTISMLLAPAACLAGGAALFNQILGLPTFLGTLVMLVLTVLVCIFSAKAVRLFGTALTVGMIICVAIIAGFGIAANWDTISGIIKNRTIYTTFGEGIWWGVLYGFVPKRYLGSRSGFRRWHALSQ